MNVGDSKHFFIYFVTYPTVANCQWSPQTHCVSLHVSILKMWLFLECSRVPGRNNNRHLSSLLLSLSFKLFNALLVLDTILLLNVLFASSLSFLFPSILVCFHFSLPTSHCHSLLPERFFTNTQCKSLTMISISLSDVSFFSSHF